jgi:hypothetical protein
VLVGQRPAQRRRLHLAQHCKRSESHRVSLQVCGYRCSLPVTIFPAMLSVVALESGQNAKWSLGVGAEEPVGNSSRIPFGPQPTNEFHTERICTQKSFFGQQSCELSLGAAPSI